MSGRHPSDVSYHPKRKTGPIENLRKPIIPFTDWCRIRGQHRNRFWAELGFPNTARSIAASSFWKLRAFSPSYLPDFLSDLDPNNDLSPYS